MRPFTSGSNATQYVVLRQRVGTPREEPIQLGDRGRIVHASSHVLDTGARGELAR